MERSFFCVRKGCKASTPFLARDYDFPFSSSTNRFLLLLLSPSLVALFLRSNCRKGTREMESKMEARSYAPSWKTGSVTLLFFFFLLSL